MNVIAGIDPKKKTCELVGIDDPETWADIRKNGYIAVPVSQETARAIFCNPVADVYAIAAAPQEPTP